jgi:hypothetical protein
MLDRWSDAAPGDGRTPQNQSADCLKPQRIEPSHGSKVKAVFRVFRVFRGSNNPFL